MLNGVLGLALLALPAINGAVAVRATGDARWDPPHPLLFIAVFHTRRRDDAHGLVGPEPDFVQRVRAASEGHGRGKVVGGIDGPRTPLNRPTELHA